MGIQKKYFCLIVMLQVAGIADAGTIFESSTLGQVGVSWDQLIHQSVPGTNINPDVFVGARFGVDRTLVTTRIGGHFVSWPSYPAHDFFGAIVRLSDEQDFPDSGDLSTTDVLALTSLLFPHPSDEAFGNVSVTLQPGWYAVVFGSGLFGTSGVGGAVRNGEDIGPQSYFGWQPGTTSWHELDSFFDNHRFVVEGYAIPEPATASLAILAAVSLALFSRRRCRKFAWHRRSGLS